MTPQDADQFQARPLHRCKVAGTAPARRPLWLQAEELLPLSRGQDLRSPLHHGDTVLELGRMGGIERRLQRVDGLQIRRLGQHGRVKLLLRGAHRRPEIPALPALLHQRPDLCPLGIRQVQLVDHGELKVPLARSADHPYAIDTAPGKAIGVGLETGKMPQRSSGHDRGGGLGGGGGGGGGVGGGMPGGGRGRGGGGMGGGGGRGGRGGDPQQAGQPPKPLKSWATVAIAPGG